MITFLDEETKTAIKVVGTIVIAIAVAVGFSMFESKQEKRKDQKIKTETTVAPTLGRIQ